MEGFFWGEHSMTIDISANTYNGDVLRSVLGKHPSEFIMVTRIHQSQ